MIEKLQAMLDAGTAIGDFGEIVQAGVLLRRVEERTVIS
jgi:hypothetical protein